MKRLLLTVVLWSIFTSAAFAHEVRPAFLRIAETDTAGHYDIMWREPLKGGMRLKILPVFPGNCKEVSRGSTEQTETALTQNWRLACEPTDSDDPDGTDGFTELAGHEVKIDGLELTLVDVFIETIQQDGTSATHILKPSQPTFIVSFSGSSTRQGYIGLGIEHLISGFDHILFVIALVLLIRTPMTLFKVITSFTVAHSLTLALSTFGLVRLEQASVEAVIALSIMFLAVEIVKAREGRTSLILENPWAITFVFGLLHGFGFAGALADIGLPEGAAARALLFFNIGVEIGQIIIVAATLIVLYLLRHLPNIIPSLLTQEDSLTPAPDAAKPTSSATAVPSFDKALTIGAAYVIGALAAYWFIERTLGLF